MLSMDDLKTNRDTQITVGCIAFFLLAFPLYFSMQSGGSSGTSYGGVGDYTIEGNISYVAFDSGMEYIADGDTFSLVDLHTDSIDGAEDMNIVGVRLTLSYGEDETARPSPLCLSQTAPDTITGMAMHAGFNGTADGQNGGQNGGHDLTVEWFNSSMVGANVSGLSESQIISQIDSMGAGLGAYEASVSVAVERDSCTNPAFANSENEDNGEEVTYTLELMVFDYTISSVS
jgi:hypothetical protein